ncbi:MAG: tRNA 2-thiouridine(34) synthase MnmA, partial [Lachnospiraceae bacterium]|nr:tRNA 2-thiouridine(34) synthase MnmA [Lachnospiraceae bacterium]
ICVGATMKLYMGEQTASDSDAEDARAVAEAMGMTHYVFDFQKEFEQQVIKRFVETYAAGATPNPCIICNRYMKFEKLMEEMYKFGCDYVVTGHYARIAYDDKSGRYLLKKGIDAAKDQSYVLYNLTQEQLAHTLFPLGEYQKEEIRELAEKQGFSNAHKSDSQDICFVRDGDYARFIEEYSGMNFPEGDFVLEDGTVMGRHKGIIRYTIGQRRGLGLSLPEPLYVCGRSMEKNQVVLGKNDRLFTTAFTAGDVNWISAEPLSDSFRCKVKIRYKQQEAWATVTPLSEDSIRVEFDEPQRGITNGQAAVLYDGDVVMGGGTIL